MAPHGDIVEAELVPPEVEHGLVEVQDTFACDTHGRRHELLQALVNATALVFVYAGEEMPESEHIASARLVQDDG